MGPVCTALERGGGRGRGGGVFSPALARVALPPCTGPAVAGVEESTPAPWGGLSGVLLSCTAPQPLLLSPPTPLPPTRGWKGICFPLARVHAEPGCQAGRGGEAKPRATEQGL